MGERERFICLNHPDREEWVFDSAQPEPVCPKCKKSEYVFGYHGDKKPIRKEKNSEDSKKKDLKKKEPKKIKRSKDIKKKTKKTKDIKKKGKRGRPKKVK